MTKRPDDQQTTGDETEITPEMIEVGVRAAELIGWRWGWDSEEMLVLRVYQAMDAARGACPWHPPASSAREHEVRATTYRSTRAKWIARFRKNPPQETKPKKRISI